MNSELSNRLARQLLKLQITAWMPPVFAIIGLAMVMMYLTASTGDGGALGFGVANLLLSLYLFTVRGFQQLLGNTRHQQHPIS
ncbi:hypothetical protein [Wenzhouxiangella sp. EGI_FJ10409]|uniref:hypothetical protein n=1 Tax=Wenzhouxiangella sp. EGI_FJ10409 TaxID=3243767 RepID=UPI0035D5A58D